MCSEKLRLAISRHTRTILGIVSDLLMRYDGSNVDPLDTVVFFIPTPSALTPELWLQSRAQEREAASELARVKNLVDLAEARYRGVAPLGKMTGWFSNPEGKTRINAAKETRDGLKRECQRAESKHAAILATLHSNAEHILRNAMSPEGIKALLEKSSVRTKLRNALDAMNREIGRLWHDHTETQLKSLEVVRSATSELLAVYKNPTTTQTSLLGGANASTRD